MSSSKERPSKLYPSFFEELPSLSGKKVVVTGASRGLGYVTALSCAKKGAEVIMLCRSSNAAEQALALNPNHAKALSAPRVPLWESGHYPEYRRPKILQ